ncbi:uncharacterized protein L969DRAFT_624267 [Mixia osmundae IAM 14324]|uniref:FAS1 domain-containing protein n=1 Tax=Mixia osmundae (strain CBS 9802 / IAM 14324 / JCM 22182 / KY 12970) TaxID=764103 RepID=G7E1A0_MIXOS|nr:uncharacterized protein L969DRAFT_624267 [Mixia osmundae IAM 14324]KEI38752.1 hypothetical protein L969DRAFT_624267 [Mixia osmundae IAM 14324]GAA96610.1 hypothetical protein E5Q_03280 [Mixia osmundae IAM 14324]
MFRRVLLATAVGLMAMSARATDRRTAEDLSADQLVFNTDKGPIATSALPSLSDMLTVQRSASFFYDYLREGSVAERLAAPVLKTTLFVPTNTIISQLARKPHEGAPGEEKIYSTEKDEEKARAEYLQDWVKTHAVAESLELKLDDLSERDSLLKDHPITFTRAEAATAVDAWASILVGPRQARVIDAVECSNGWIYMLDGVLGL